MNFSNFTKQKVDQPKSNEKTFTEEDARKTYDELKDLNSDQLTERLFSEVARQKSEGTFDYEGLAKSLEGIKGYLPEETYQNIKRMLKTLR